jgi:hypothetical protein
MKKGKVIEDKIKYRRDNTYVATPVGKRRRF